MAISVMIRKKGLFKKNITFEEILLEGISYGIMDDAWRLKENERGDYTIFFSPKHLCRGFEVHIEKNALYLSLPLPTSDEDVCFFYDYIDKICQKFSVSTFLRDEVETSVDHIETLKKDDTLFCHDTIRKMKEDVNHKNTIQFIMGVMNPVALDKDDFKNISSAIDFGKYLHQIQGQDLYYAKASVYERKDGSYFGVYVCTCEIDSVFPHEAMLFMPTQNFEIKDWYIGFVVDKNMQGFIPYQDFLENVDKDKRYDAKNFIVKLNKEKIEMLLKNFKVKI